MHLKWFSTSMMHKYIHNLEFIDSTISDHSLNIYLQIFEFIRNGAIQQQICFKTNNLQPKKILG